MDLELRNKVALVTGGSRGLGRAICLALAAEGAKVAIHYFRDQGRNVDMHADALDVAHAIQAACGTPARPVPGDIARPEDIVEIFNLAETTLGPVGVLVNNAGIWPTACVKDITLEQWNQTLQVNLTGAFLTCQEAVRRWLTAGRKGRIVNIVSPAAFQGATTGHAHYAASKAGMVALTVSLAREVAAQGICVNAVAPGLMDTEMARQAIDSNLDHYLKRIPLGRVADPAEVAAAVAFLASPRASYVTGATWDVTGGMLMR